MTDASSTASAATRKAQTALITGASSGIGKEVARQLALTDAYRRIYLACRDEAKGERAKRDLERVTGKAVFRIVRMDVADLASVRAALASLEGTVDDLVMNAGGSGGPTPLARTKDGVTEIFASNVLGHVALLEGLIAAGRLGGTAIYVGSEAARGVPAFKMQRPQLNAWSVDEFASPTRRSPTVRRSSSARCGWGRSPGGIRSSGSSP